MVARTALALFALAAAGTAHAHQHHHNAHHPHHHKARQDPHAIPPLAEISHGMPTEPAVPLAATPVAGSPAVISGAPKLPAIPDLSGYPAGGGAPLPTDTPDVKQWLADIAAAGVTLPTTTPNIPVPEVNPPKGASLCSLNPAASTGGGADGTCWWSCSVCTRDTDVVQCPDKLSWGLTFDDGPSPYTPKVLNYLAANDLKASFYVIGANIVNHPEILQATYLAGHEIAIHTWTHRPLTTLSNEQIVAELGYTRKAIQAVLGVTPRYFRPPYGDTDDRVRAVAKGMGLIPVIWTEAFDTNDWSVNSGALSTDLMAGYTKMLETLPTLPNGVISLQHDWYQETTDLAVGYFLPAALSHNPKPNFQTVIECQHQAIGASYVETLGSGGSSPAPAPAPANNATISPAPSASATASSTSVSRGSSVRVVYSTIQGGSASAAAAQGTTSANGASALSVGFSSVFGVVLAVVGVLGM
ncbi:glycoside hydrolase/deacetylase [Ceratobasidium sp. AG-I]|nr:glycoside hydrolase/deacetylase [Ceratobasidium sp. AG-I]